MMFDQAAKSARISTDTSVSESLADLLFEIGRDLFRRQDYYRASKWLERAHGVLSECDMEQFNLDAQELRLSISHYVGASRRADHVPIKRRALTTLKVRAYIGLKTNESLKKAEDSLAWMETACLLASNHDRKD